MEIEFGRSEQKAESRLILFNLCLSKEEHLSTLPAAQFNNLRLICYGYSIRILPPVNVLN